MPQLDKVHFLSQYFWLCVFYFGFYFLISKHFLPAVARVLQLRKNKSTHTFQVHSELKNVQESASTALDNVFSTSHKFWSQNTRRISDWYKHKVLNCNRNYLQQCNKLYIRWLGDYSLSESAALIGLQATTGKLHYTGFLLRQCTNSYPSLPSIKVVTKKTTRKNSTNAEITKDSAKKPKIGKTTIA